MSQAALKSVPPITKSIPLKKIVFRPDCSPRLELRPEHVKKLEDYYSSPNHPLPPLEVLLIQTGDSRTAFYLPLEGAHRREALIRLKAKDVLCNVHTTPVYTEKNLKEERVRQNIKFMASEYSLKVPLVLNRLETIELAKGCKAIFKKTNREIAKDLGIPLKTMNDWLAETNKAKKVHVKADVIERIKKGDSVNKIHNDTGVAETTIMTWKNQEGLGKGGGSKVGKPDFTTPPAINDDPATAGSPSPNTNDEFPKGTESNESTSFPDDTEERAAEEEKQKAETAASLTKMGNQMRSLFWSDEADEMIITEFFKILSLKSETLKRVLNTKDGLAARYEDYKGKYELEQERHAATTKGSLAKDAEIQRLKADLVIKREECKKSCDHSKAWARERHEFAVKHLLETITDLQTVVQGQRLFYGPGKKKVMTVPKQALPLAGQLALNSVYKTLSHFDWSIRERLYSPEAVHMFYKFLRIVETLGFHKREDVLKRVRLLDEEFSKARTQ